MPPTKKTQTAKAEPDEDLIDMGSDGEVMDEPTVTNWANESAPQNTTSSRPSRDIVKITPEEAKTLESQTVSDTSINDLLRTLIRRGYDGQNPALAKGAERLIMQLNCIPLRPPGPRRRQTSRFNNRRNGYKRNGGSRRDSSPHDHRSNEQSGAPVESAN